MKTVELENDEIIKKWLNKKKSKNTIKSYLQAMYFYTDLLEKNPDELIQEAEDELRSGKLMRERNILGYFDEYVEFLEDRDLAPKTIEGYICAIRSFYKKNHIEVPQIERKKAKPLKKNREIPTKEELQDVIGACDLLEKAIVLTGISSGLSDVDIVNLKISDFKNGYDPENKITVLRLTRTKVDIDFITFLSPEATDAINDYLTKHRTREPKTNFQRDRDRLEKQKIRNDNGYLFIRKHVLSSYLVSGDEEERKITPSNLIQIYRGISESAKKNAPFGDWNLIRSHNMRKYFYNILINNKCPYPHAEHMMGHVLDSVRDAYFAPTEEELKKSYIACIPHLTIEKKLDISVSPEYKAAIERADKAEAEALRVSVERDEIQRLKTGNDQKFKALESSFNEKLCKSVEYTTMISRFEFQVQDLKKKKEKEPDNKTYDELLQDSLKHAKNLTEKLKKLMEQ